MKKNKFTLHLTPYTVHRKTGFTVMEVLIAMAIIAVILSSTFVIFKGATGSWKRGEAKASLYQQARSIFDTVSRDISQSVKGVCLLSGGMADIFSGNSDSLIMTSPMGDAGEIVEVSYILDNTSFIRRVGEDVDGYPDTFDYSESLSDGIDAVTFSYLYQGAWLDSFNAADTNCLPKAVKLKLDIEKSSFEIIIRIETS